METIATLKDDLGKVFFTCYLIESNSILECVWIGDCDRVECGKKAASSIIDCIHQFRIQKVIDDNRLGYGKWPDILDWLESTWKPELVQAGVTSYAHILSPDKISKKTAHQIFNQVIDQTTFITFDTYDRAIDWIKA